MGLRMLSVLVASVSIVTGCTGTTNEPEVISQPVTSAVQESVFIIEGVACGKSSLGTGVLIDQGVLTNAHVVAGTESLTLKNADGLESETFVIAIDFESDLAILDGSNILRNPLPVGEPVAEINGLVIVGSAGLIEAVPVQVTRLITISMADIYGEGQYLRSGMELSASVAPGDSGGPIINASGEVIGIVFSRSTSDEDVSYGISSEEFEKVIAKADPDGVASGECRQ
ncbi:MAG: trypsin-like peptidase domain-containing protein [Actinomycetota bacterium]|nr:trypsin-like peptidase domain-containing protein [Actinomycetota bacterium]